MASTDHLASLPPRDAAGRYRIESPLGSGGFACVYRAHDTLLERPVALKVLHSHLAGEADTRARFLREGRALARVRHPNVVAVYDAGETEQMVFLAMELIEGRSLAQRLADDGAFTLDEVIALTDPISEALTAIHAQGLVHCDVKPANILIEERTGRAVLLDLGVARTLDDTALTSGLLWGTPAFMAPEQVLPDGRISPCTDVYQLGATLYALLSGAPPFEGTVSQLFYAVAHGAPPDLTVTAPHLLPAVAELIRHCMAKEPAARPDSPRAVFAALRDTRHAHPVRAPWSRGHTEAFAPIAAAPPRSAPATPTVRAAVTPAPDRPAERSRTPGRVLAAAAAGVAVAVALGAGLLLRGNGDDSGNRTALAPESTATVEAVATEPPSATEALSAAEASPATATAAPATPAPAAAPPTAAPATAPPATTAPTQPPRTPTPAPTQPAIVQVSPPGSGNNGRGENSNGIEARDSADAAAALAAAMAGRGFSPTGSIIQTAPAPGGGVLAVQRGSCGRDCVMLFIALDGRFIGTDWPDPSFAITDLRATGPGEFRATYSDGDDDANVTFTYRGNRLRPDRIPPGHCQRGC